MAPGLIPEQTFSSRPASPHVEIALQSAIQLQLTALFTTKGLYQNVKLSEDVFAKYKDADGLQREFRRRPMCPESTGDGSPELRGFGLYRGVSVRETLPEQTEFRFFIPNINLLCSTCKGSTTFLSMNGSSEREMGTPYPIAGDDTEQLWTIYYRCGSCRTTFITFLVLRRGFRLQLVGRSSPYRPSLAPEWPKAIRTVVQDALTAVSENDVAAGFYHLRTAVEHFIKDEIGMPLIQKIDGTELCDRYNDKADARLKTGFPSLGPIYSSLSAGMHSRQVTVEEFEQHFKGFLGHLKAKTLFAEFGP